MRDHYRADGWVAYRLPQPSAGDVLALRAGAAPKLIQVKSTAGGPFERFGPVDRAALLAEANQAGAHALLAWWPPGGKLRLIGPSEWPATRAPPT